ncbi:hypothetical protein [uncultured Porphyromonas sp.]|nr:hypothetical protein [uncultured Porphyromonas sp.]
MQDEVFVNAYTESVLGKHPRGCHSASPQSEGRIRPERLAG